jgi:hypothetical protein
MNYSEHETIETIADGVVQLECRCGRKYWATEAVAKSVDEGKLENLCGQCDGSHEVEGDDL